MELSTHSRIKRSLFDDERMSFKEAIETSIASLNAYGDQYKHWSIAYSGGKDSTATVSFVIWCLDNGFVKWPQSLTISYADTRQEIPPLERTAKRLMNDLSARGVNTQITLPALDHRFYVYILGMGVVPPNNRMRWCTPKLKIFPMNAALEKLRGDTGEKFLQITGVRQGESALRDAKIAISCSKGDGECGQGWFQSQPSEHVADTLAPLVHWRQCFVWDWLYFAYHDAYMKQKIGIDAKGHGFDYLDTIAVAYGQTSLDNSGQEIIQEGGRTGCIGCPLAAEDKALINLISWPEWSHMKPLTQIRSMLWEMRKAKYRLRKAAPEKKTDGTWRKKGQRMGPMSIDARQYFYHRIMRIQHQTGVELINLEERTRIHQLWKLNAMPEKWEGGLSSPNNIPADVLFDQITVVGDGKTKIIQHKLPINEGDHDLYNL